MKLPLTLAIIQALLVNVADELYSIPLDAVIESQRINAADVRTVHGGEVITLRGQVVPLIRIADFFRLDAPRDPDKVMIVIVGLQGRQVGLVVDSFQGEQEIVIKPLSDVIGRIAGISGATILGNGSISLIIDVHSLVAAARGSGKVTRAEFSGVHCREPLPSFACPNKEVESSWQRQFRSFRSSSGPKSTASTSRRFRRSTAWSRSRTCRARRSSWKA